MATDHYLGALVSEAMLATSLFLIVPVLVGHLANPVEPLANPVEPLAIHRNLY